MTQANIRSILSDVEKSLTEMIDQLPLLQVGVRNVRFEYGDYSMIVKADIVLIDWTFGDTVMSKEIVIDMRDYDMSNSEEELSLKLYRRLYRIGKRFIESGIS